MKDLRAVALIRQFTLTLQYVTGLSPAKVGWKIQGSALTPDWARHLITDGYNSGELKAQGDPVDAVIEVGRLLNNGAQNKDKVE